MLKSSRLNLIIITTISHDFKQTNSTYSSVWLWSNQDLYAMTEQLWRCHAHSTRQSVFPHHNTGTTHNHTVHPNDCFFLNITITLLVEIMKWILPNWPFYAGQMVFLVASNTSHVLYSWLFISFSDKTVSLISLVTFTRYGDSAGTMTRKTPAASAWTECTSCHQQGHVGLKHCSNKIFLLGLVRDYIFTGLMTFPSITSISVLTKTFMKPEVDGKLAYMHSVKCTCTDNRQPTT